MFLIGLVLSYVSMLLERSRPYIYRVHGAHTNLAVRYGGEGLAVHSLLQGAFYRGFRSDVYIWKRARDTSR